MFQRRLCLPRPSRHSYFLWGPRQTGKSWLLRETYPEAPRRDLLDTDLYARYLARPGLLREELAGEPAGKLVVLDEIQKVPALLDEVHWLIENQGLVFALCGSSARKVRRGHANLLGGRALRYELFGLVSAELGQQFDLIRMLNHGYLPRHYLEDQPAPLLRAYVNDYLKEEVAAEGLVRNLSAFANFLQMAALGDTETLSYSNIARDCGVSGPTVKEYYQILVETLLGRLLPAFVRRPKRRVQHAPKFYFADVGAVNHLTRRGELRPATELFGKAFENWLAHELSAYGSYSGLHPELSYWRLSTGAEVDFVLNDAEIAIEAKAVSSVHSEHLKGLRQFRFEQPGVKQLYMVSLERLPRRTEDGILILPAAEFATRLWEGDILSG
ncbi:MAG: hypothetical protein AMXMBFR33_32020 [Candidatus Xenobia bacterium]